MSDSRAGAKLADEQERDTSIAKRGLLMILVIGVLLLLAMPSECAYSPRNRISAEKEIREGFPGFRVLAVSPIQELGLGSFDSVAFSGYYFRLESRAVPGFVVAVRYLIGGAGYDKARQEAIVTRGMFSGNTLSSKELEALEREWVKSHQGEVVPVGTDAVTGPAVIALRNGEVAPRYRELDVAEVYCLESGGTYNFYRLDRAKGHWTALREFRDR